TDHIGGAALRRPCRLHSGLLVQVALTGALQRIDRPDLEAVRSKALLQIGYALELGRSKLDERETGCRRGGELLVQAAGAKRGSVECDPDCYFSRITPKVRPAIKHRPARSAKRGGTSSATG